MSMYLIKKDKSDCDKYYYREFKKLYGFESCYSMKITLMLLKQYYECAIIKERNTTPMLAFYGSTIDENNIIHNPKGEWAEC
jgi:hypothetical protein